MTTENLADWMINHPYGLEETIVTKDYAYLQDLVKADYPDETVTSHNLKAAVDLANEDPLIQDFARLLNAPPKVVTPDKHD